MWQECEEIPFPLLSASVLSRIGANPCIHEGCKEQDLEHKKSVKMSKIGNLFFFSPDFPGLPAVPAVSQALFQPRCPAAHAPGEFFWDKTWEFQRGDSLEIPGFAASTHPWLKTFFSKRIPGWFGWVDRSTSHLSQVVPANPAFLERKISIFHGGNSWNLAFPGYFCHQGLVWQQLLHEGSGNLGGINWKKEIQEFQLCPVEMDFLWELWKGKSFYKENEFFHDFKEDF